METTSKLCAFFQNRQSLQGYSSVTIAPEAIPGLRVFGTICRKSVANQNPTSATSAATDLSGQTTSSDIKLQNTSFEMDFLYLNDEAQLKGEYRLGWQAALVPSFPYREAYLGTFLKFKQLETSFFFFLEVKILLEFVYSSANKNFILK